MALNLGQEAITVTLNNQETIDGTKASPTTGTNIKLIDTTTPTNFFVGTISRLVASIQNADSGIFTSMILDGVDNTGTKKTITVTIDDLKNNTYANGLYSGFFYTSKLSSIPPDVVYDQSVDSLIVSDATIETFSSFVVVGNLIAFKLADDTEVEGVISQVSPDGTNIRVSAIVSGRIGTITLTLVQATDTSGFDGGIITVSYL